MSFQIIEILNPQPEKILAIVSHQNNRITVLVSNKKVEDLVIGKSFQAEIGYDEILDWKVIPDFEDAKSGIWQEKDVIHLLGRIHSILDYGDGKTIIDVYMQNGPEYFTVNSEVIDSDSLESNAGLQITVSNLYIYPNDQ